MSALLINLYQIFPLSGTDNTCIIFCVNSPRTIEKCMYNRFLHCPRFPYIQEKGRSRDETS